MTFSVHKQILNRDKDNQEQTDSKQHIPYGRAVNVKIERILIRQDIQTTSKPAKTIKALLNNPKDNINLENQGIYKMTSGNNSETYIEQTNRLISTKVDGHKLVYRNKHLTLAP